MKAAQINEYGDASVVEINEIDRPSVGQGQVGIDVYASSINPIDTILREGHARKAMPLTFPITIGGDFSGIVTELGDGVADLQVGDRVYGQANARHGDSGAFAEFLVTTADQVAKAPESIDFKEIASLPMAGVSALQALTDHIGLAKGQKILITGGSGGIGTLAIQIAKHIGAYVATTATGDSIEVVRALGADLVIDYKTQVVSEVLKDYDAVFNTASGGDFDDTLRALRPGGTAVSVAAQPNETLASQLGVVVMRQGTGITTERLDRLAKLVDNGVVKPQVAEVFNLQDAAAAFEAKEAGSVIGKVVIEVKKG